MASLEQPLPAAVPRAGKAAGPVAPAAAAPAPARSSSAAASRRPGAALRLAAADRTAAFRGSQPQCVRPPMGAPRALRAPVPAAAAASLSVALRAPVRGRAARRRPCQAQPRAGAAPKSSSWPGRAAVAPRWLCRPGDARSPARRRRWRQPAPERPGRGSAGGRTSEGSRTSQGAARSTARRDCRSPHRFSTRADPTLSAPADGERVPAARSARAIAAMRAIRTLPHFGTLRDRPLHAGAM